MNADNTQIAADKFDMVFIGGDRRDSIGVHRRFQSLSPE